MGIIAVVVPVNETIPVIMSIPVIFELLGKPVPTIKSSISISLTSLRVAVDIPLVVTPAIFFILVISSS